MKKLFDVCLACVMTLCLFAGCNNEPAPQPQTTPDTTDTAVKTPVTVGTLMLTAGASVNISYDADGLVSNVEGADSDGSVLAEKYTDYLGKACSVAIAELIDASAKEGFLTPHVKNIVIKRYLRSQAPTDFFMETLETEAKTAIAAAGSAAAVVLIQADEMDEHGYITLATVKKLLSNQLGVEQLDKYYGSAVPVDGVYICTVEIAGVQSYHKIDAFTCQITEATAEELLGDPENNDESFEDDLTIDEPVEDTMPGEPEEELLN